MTLEWLFRKCIGTDCFSFGLGKNAIKLVGRLSRDFMDCEDSKRNWRFFDS